MSRVFVFYDKEVEAFAKKFCEGRAIEAWYPLDVSEDAKTLGSVEKICSFLLSHRADRSSVLLAIGGGVVCDLVGFVAAIYKRGVSFESVPTTLLSQVDAAIGGKTGVNLEGIKNAVGAFKSPGKVWILPSALAGLPEREVRSGLAEMLKAFIISSERLYEKALELFSRPDVDICSEEVHTLVLEAGAIKRRIVRRDPFELRGERTKLNLGHTVGHAINCRQILSGEPLMSHGETVAIGIVHSAKTAFRLGLAKEGLAEKISMDFESVGLPTALPFPIQELIPAIRNDKKVDDGLVRFVLPRAVGKVVVRKIRIEEI